MSMKPGATTQPVASSSSSPRRFGRISLMTPSEIATSAMRPSAPLPSNTVPPRITQSADITTPGQQLLQRARRGTGGGAAVDRQHDASDLRGTLARQVQHGVGHVAWRSYALERLQGTHERRLIQRRVDRGGNVCRSDAVDPDAVLRQFDRDRPREMDDRRLRRSVGHQTGAGVDSTNRRGVDDHTAAVRRHVPGGALAADDDAVEVDRDHAVEIAQVVVEKTLE